MGLSDNIRFFAATDPGRVREHNEDNYLVDRKLSLFVVADGMGGHAAGEVASALAVRMLHEEVKAHRELLVDFARGELDHASGGKRILAVLEAAVQHASSRIHEEARADAARRGMGTTLSALLIAGSHGFVAHVGDSRIYILREGRVRQLTDDHTVINELIKRGKLTREQIEKVAQKNAITRAVGVYERVEVDTLTLELFPGDQFLLASDGLHGYVAHSTELESFFEEADGEVATRGLIDLANQKGGKDNITAILVRLGDGTLEDRARAKLLALTQETLSKMPLFSRLTEAELLRVMQIAELIGKDPGEVIVREGEAGDQFFVVVTGLVEVRRGDTLLADVAPGEHFGEMALIRALPRSATAVAVEPCDLLAIRRRDFFEILRKEHELAVKLLWQLLGVLADRLDQTSKDLGAAREELAAVDISSDIFPGPESDPVSVDVEVASEPEPKLGYERLPVVPAPRPTPSPRSSMPVPSMGPTRLAEAPASSGFTSISPPPPRVPGVSSAPPPPPAPRPRSVAPPPRPASMPPPRPVTLAPPAPPVTAPASAGVKAHEGSGD